MKILKIMFSDIPFAKIQKIPEIGVLEDNVSIPDEEKIFRPYLQIFKNSEIMFNSLTQNPEGEEVKVLRKTDISCWFNVNIDVFDFEKISININIFF